MASKEREEEAQEEAEPAKKDVRLVWFYGVNDHITELDQNVVKAFQATGNLHADFAGLCAQHKIAGHPALMPSATSQVKVKPNPNDADHKDEDAERPSGPAILSLQSCMLDLLSLNVLKVVMPTALHLETLRISGCHLDVAMLAALRACLTGSCTVTTLHLDWNPLEMPHDQEGLQALASAHQISDVEQVEQKRAQQQAARALGAFKEQLQAKRKGVSEAIDALVDVFAQSFPSTAMIEPLSLERWMGVFSDALGVSSEDSGRIFHILDQPEYGCADGYVSLESLQKVMNETETPDDGGEPTAASSSPPVFTDVLGSAFAAFVDSSCVLELVSFRSCNICRLETRAIASSLATSSHLRALNLWNNRICDRGAGYLAVALEHNFGLLYLGLGKNLITDSGMEKLCTPLGHTLVTEKAEADKLAKVIKDQEKELAKQQKDQQKGPGPPTDGNGRERYVVPLHCDVCNEHKDGETTYWIWTRNDVLKTLNLEQNPISDADAVEKLRPFGTGSLILRSTPCAPTLLQQQKESAQAESEEPAEGAVHNGGAKGWTLILE